MSDLGNKEIFAKNLRYYMDLKGINQTELCNALGFKFMTVSDWANAKSYPRIDKIEMMANYFKIQKSDLIEDKKKYEADVQSQLIEKYLQQSKLRELLLFAGGVEPEEARDQVIDAVISALSALRKGGKG